MLQMNLITQKELYGDLYWELYGELWGESYWEVGWELGFQIRADFSHSKISRV
jgi:hypothetical protein